MKSINLLPPDPRANSRNPLLLPLLLAAAVLLLGAQYYYHLHWQSAAEELAAEAGQIEKQIVELSSNGHSKTKAEALEKAERIVGELESGRRDWKRYLDVIVEAMPGDTGIVSMSVNDSETIHMELNFSQYERLISYAAKLEQEPLLSGVKLTSYYKQVEDQLTKEAVDGEDGTAGMKTVRKISYRLLMDLQLTNLREAS